MSSRDMVPGATVEPEPEPDPEPEPVPEPTAPDPAPEPEVQPNPAPAPVRRMSAGSTVVPSAPTPEPPPTPEPIAEPEEAIRVGPSVDRGMDGNGTVIRPPAEPPATVRMLRRIPSRRPSVPLSARVFDVTGSAVVVDITGTTEPGPIRVWLGDRWRRAEVIPGGRGIRVRVYAPIAGYRGDVPVRAEVAGHMIDAGVIGRPQPWPVRRDAT